MLIEELDKSKHNLGDVKELLAMAVGNPTPEKLTKLLNEFYTSDGRTIFIAEHNAKIIGVIGIDFTDKPLGFITHLAVLPDVRTQGTGSQLINYVTTSLELNKIRAETDQDAVGFYRACEFETEEIKSQYPGVRRFRCVKNIIASPSSRRSLQESY
jgi:N-acetylglutamate synthase-like GNAT family acetyltransferase